MKAWDDIVAAALLGSERASLPSPADGDLGALVTQLAGERPERRLLASAAIVSLWRQAGARPAPASSTTPIAPVDGDRPCSPAAAAHLSVILCGGMGMLLEEWLQALAAAGRTLPHRRLPEVLDLAAQKPALRALVDPVLGARGRWLAAQNPAWQGLAQSPDLATAGETWQTGSRDDRLTLLQALRAVDPARARELVASTWAEDPPDDRAAFLAALATGLGPDDEPFLEAALDDRRKEIRAAAATMLARLPGSRLVARMEARLRPLLVLERGFLGRAKLRVTLPEACDKAMARDGVVEKAPAGVGQRAWWLEQMLAALPPAVWCRAMGKTPGEIVSLAAGDEHHEALLEGLAAAAARAGDAEWAQALLVRWGNAPWARARRPPELGFMGHRKALMAAVPQAWLEEWLAHQMDAAGVLQRDLPVDLLECHRRPWGEELTRAFLRGLRAYALRRARAGFGVDWAPTFARYASPALAGEAEQRWFKDLPANERIDRFLAILRFRRDMLQALR